MLESTHFRNLDLDLDHELDLHAGIFLNKGSEVTDPVYI